MARINRVLDRISEFFFGRKQKGSILAITMLIMVIGMIILSGLFSILGTSLRLVSQSEKAIVSFYSADSGVETCLYALLSSTPLCNASTLNASYSLNGVSVTAQMECDTFSPNTSSLYRIRSTTLLTDIESYVRVTYSGNYTLNSSNCWNASYNLSVLTYKILP